MIADRSIPGDVGGPAEEPPDDTSRENPRDEEDSQPRQQAMHHVVQGRSPRRPGPSRGTGEPDWHQRDDVGKQEEQDEQQNGGVRRLMQNDQPPPEDYGQDRDGRGLVLGTVRPGPDRPEVGTPPGAGSRVSPAAGRPPRRVSLVVATAPRAPGRLILVVPSPTLSPTERRSSRAEAWRRSAAVAASSPATAPPGSGCVPASLTRSTTSPLLSPRGESEAVPARSARSRDQPFGACRELKWSAAVPAGTSPRPFRLPPVLIAVAAAAGRPPIGALRVGLEDELERGAAAGADGREPATRRPRDLERRAA